MQQYTILLLAAAASLAAGASAQQAASPKPDSSTKCFDVTWTTLARSGLKYGNGTYGAIKTNTGKDILQVVNATSAVPTVPLSSLGLKSSGPFAATATYKAPTGYKLTRIVSVGPDFPSMHTPAGGNRTFIINHFETPQPSTAYISEVIPADKKGNLKVVNTKAVNDAAVGGLWFMCSGSVTPWGTHLGGEEYPPDCRSYEEFFVPCKTGKEALETVCGLAENEDDAYGIPQMARYFGLQANSTKYGLSSVDVLGSKAAHDSFVKEFKCYNYGASPELSVNKDGKTSVTKWRTLGRVSHELALVMPDNRTVYTTDDIANGVLLRFVADKPSDLSSGTLYAAKLSNQAEGEGGMPEWDVSWVELGAANQSYLEKLIASNIKFNDMFEVVQPTGSPPSCPEGFDATNYVNPIYVIEDKENEDQEYYIECLKIKPGMEVAAAFLESRRVASMKGATTEFDKQEGATFSAARKQLYFVASRVRRGMTNSTTFNPSGRDDISLPENKCGAILSMDLDEDWSGTKTRIMLKGDPKSNTDDNNKCSTEAISEPDNVRYLGGNLLIQEDTSNHQNSVMWAYNLDNRNLTRIFSSPAGAEVTGLSFGVVPAAVKSAAGGKAYLVFAIQHPVEDIDGEDTGVYTADEVNARRGYLGYIGPIPSSILSEDYTLTFDGIPLAKGDDTAKTVSTARVCATKNSAATSA